jgi:cytochrome d ubiquinol oxidase subunit II
MRGDGGLTATTLFPNIVPATDAALSITVASAASSDAALGAMTVITCIGLPLVLLYHFLVYRSFAGRVSSDDAAE